jgi:hypothetical protein
MVFEKREKCRIEFGLGKYEFRAIRVTIKENSRKGL